MRPRTLVPALFILCLFYSCQGNSPTGNGPEDKTVRSGPDCAASSPVTSIKNILLFTLDTVRQDQLGGYGHPAIKTPMLDRCIRSGYQFSDAYAESCWTIPSHASLFTSLYPRTHGAIRPHPHLDDELITIADVLTKHGFYCGAVVAASIFKAKTGFNQGFSYYDDHLIASESRPGELITEKATEFIASRRHHSFFLWVHYFDAHYPYDPPAPYDLFYCWEGLSRKGKKSFQKSRKMTVTDKAFAASNHGETNTTDLEIARALYQGEISYIDKQIEHVIRLLYREGLDKNTLVILVSDHGEYFGEDGYYYQHMVDLGQPVITIPYVFLLPDAQGHEIITEPVQLIDVLPTLIRLCGISHPQPEFHGKDLYRLLKKTRSFSQRYCYSEFHPTSEDKHYYSLVDGRTKYKQVLTSQEQQDFLYSLDQDNIEADISGQYPDKIRLYQSLLSQWKQDYDQKEATKDYQIPDELQKSLKVLGYTD
ncbi:sulfatase [bacterium]|nr:sulfatase [bacterium]